MKKFNILLLVLFFSVLGFMGGIATCQSIDSTQMLETQYNKMICVEPVKTNLEIYPILDDRFIMNINQGQILINNTIKKTAVSISPNNVYFMGAGFTIELYVDVNGDLMARSGELTRKIADF